jgi:uncharacterized protein YecE (DUF72 family)
MIRIGCSGWNYEDWKGLVYPSGEPARRWLELYAQRFDTVEINATFYRLPERKIVTRWAEQTPARFCFAVKASRYLTHVKRLRDLRPGLERLYERIEPLHDARKLGPLLWQLPPRFRRDDDRLGDALAALPRGRHALEFRDESWFADGVYELLRAHGAALVVADRAPTPPTPGSRRRNGRTSASIVDGRAGARTAAGRSAPGRDGSPRRPATSTRTSTTTGRASRSRTRARCNAWSTGADTRALPHGRAGGTRYRPPGDPAAAPPGRRPW